MPNYGKSAHADDVSIFCGRELRGVPTASGGTRFVPQLSCAEPLALAAGPYGDAGAVAGEGAIVARSGEAADPRRWSSEGIATYDGRGADSLRKRQNGPANESEGFGTFSKRFGKGAFGLNHCRFLHSDGWFRVWLSAEDESEGALSEGRSWVGRLGGVLFGK